MTALVLRPQNHCMTSFQIGGPVYLYLEVDQTPSPHHYHPCPAPLLSQTGKSAEVIS